MEGELEGSLCTVQLGSILVLSKTGEMWEAGLDQIQEHEVKIVTSCNYMIPSVTSCICNKMLLGVTTSCQVNYRVIHSKWTF